MLEILKFNGSNKNKLAHLKKDKFFQENHSLSKSLTFPITLHDQATFFGDSHANLFIDHIAEQRLDLLGPESDDEDTSNKEDVNVTMLEI